MKAPARQERKIVAAAEKQMRTWTFVQELAERTIRLDQAHPAGAKLGRYIAISREAGVGVEEIAPLIGQALGWEVLDKELLDLVADGYRLNPSMLELVDETRANWAFDVLGTWLDAKIIPREKYVVHLTRIVLAAAERGNVVFVGRGVAFLLPPQHGLAVRIIAPEEYRVEQIMRREQLDAAKARRRMQELDRGRQDFVRWFFGKDATDPCLYDMVLNVGRLGPEATAELIVEAHRRRRGGPPRVQPTQ